MMEDLKTLGRRETLLELIRGAFSWRDYGSARLTRLWVVLLPALLLTFAIDLGLRQVVPGGLSGGYATIWNMGPQPGDNYTLGVGVFIRNLLFLLEMFVPVFGSNDPLWSLAYEFWYYALFPLLLIGLGGTLGAHRMRGRGLALIGAGLILVLLPNVARVGFLCWLVGVGVYALRRAAYAIRVSVWLGVAIFAVGIGLSRWLGKAAYPTALVDLSMAVAMVSFLSAIANRVRPRGCGCPG